MLSRRKKLAFTCVTFAVAMMIAIAAFELLGQRVLYREKLYFINDVDHRMLPYSRPDVNGDGVRCPIEPHQFRPQDYSIIFLGDSFIYGYDLEYPDTIPARFAQLAAADHPDLPLKVANFGWVSSSPLLSLRLLKDIGRKYHPDLVILGLDMTDFHDDIKYRKLIERDGAHRLIGIIPITFLAAKKAIANVPQFDGLHEGIFGYPASRYFISDRPLTQSLWYLDHTRQQIDAIHAYCRGALGAEFALVILPRSYQYSTRESPNSWEKDAYENLGPHALAPFDYFEHVGNSAPYPVYSLLKDFQHTAVFPTCFNDDPHYNPAGAAVAAEAIYAKVKLNMP